jgi:hypothetical protein
MRPTFLLRTGTLACAVAILGTAVNLHAEESKVLRLTVRTQELRQNDWGGNYWQAVETPPASLLRAWKPADWVRRSPNPPASLPYPLARTAPGATAGRILVRPDNATCRVACGAPPCAA